MYKITLSVFVLSLLTSHCVFAEQLNLKAAINELNQSPRIEKSESQLEEAKWKKAGALTGFLPDVYAKANHVLKQKYIFSDIVMGGANVSVPNLVPATIYSVGFSLPLFDGFANVNRYSAASKFERSQSSELDWSRFQATREVIVLFYKSLGSKILKEVAVQNLKALEDHLNDVLLFKKQGISTKFDVLRVEVQKSEATTEVLSATDNESTTLIKLGEVLGHELENRTLEGKLPLLSKDIINNLDEDYKTRSDLVSLNEKVASLNELDSAEGKYLVPKIGLYGEYLKYNNRNYDLTGSESFRNAYSVGVQLTWNLFDGMKSISKDKVSIEQKYQMQKNLKMAEIKAHNDVAFWKKKFIYFCDVSRARLNDIDKAEESVRLAREGRKVGIRTNADLLDAEAELYRARASGINAQLGSIEALVNLELATGKEIYKF